jgi:Na+/proline symporter
MIHLTTAEVAAGLPAVKAVAALAGKSGACALLLLLFLAVTSAASAEQIAVSSLLTYDVYGTYINKAPTEKQILWVSHLCILGYAIFMGAIATAFNYIGISMGYLYELMGTIIGSAVVPIAACICWRKANGTGAVAGAILGFCAGVAGWLGVTSALNNGVIDITTTFGDYEMLTGNLLAIGVGAIVTVVWSLISPVDFDWEITRAINANAGKASAAEQTPDSETSSVAEVVFSTPPNEKSDAKVDKETPAEQVEGDVESITDDERRGLTRAFRFAAYVASFLTFALIIAIPLPQFFASYIYSKSGFTAWVVIVIMWLFGGLIMVGLYPMWEARASLKHVSHGIMRDIKGVKS